MPPPDGPHASDPSAYARSSVGRSRNRVRLPDLLAGRRVERHDAAAKRAAAVAGRLAAFFVRRRRYIEAAREQRRRSGQPDERMVVDFAAPQQAPVRCVQCVDVALLIRDEGRLGRAAAGPAAAAQRADGHRCANAAVRRERPGDAPARGVERIDRAVLTADEQASARDRRLRPRRCRVRKTKRPFQLQPRYLSRRQPGLRRGLKMRVLRCRSPPVPQRTGGGIAERLRTGTPARSPHR